MSLVHLIESVLNGATKEIKMKLHVSILEVLDKLLTSKLTAVKMLN